MRSTVKRKKNLLIKKRGQKKRNIIMKQRQASSLGIKTSTANKLSLPKLIYQGFNEEKNVITA